MQAHPLATVSPDETVDGWTNRSGNDLVGRYSNRADHLKRVERTARIVAKRWQSRPPTPVSPTRSSSFGSKQVARCNAECGCQVIQAFDEQAAPATLDLDEERPVDAGCKRELFLRQAGREAKAPH